MADEDPDVVQHDDSEPQPPRQGKAKFKIVITNANGKVIELNAIPKRAQFVPQLNGSMVTLFVPGQNVQFGGPKQIQQSANLLDAHGNPARIGGGARLFLPPGTKRTPPDAGNTK